MSNINIGKQGAENPATLSTAEVAWDPRRPFAFQSKQIAKTEGQSTKA